MCKLGNDGNRQCRIETEDGEVNGGSLEIHARKREVWKIEVGWLLDGEGWEKNSMKMLKETYMQRYEKISICRTVVDENIGRHSSANSKRQQMEAEESNIATKVKWRK